MDSLTQDIKLMYEAMGVSILIRDDDNYTDCEKALLHLEQTILPSVLAQGQKKVRIVVLGAFGGRMDHTLQNLHLLWQKGQTSSTIEYLMLDRHNLVSVLKPGRNVLTLSKRLEGRKGVGVIPFTECSSISSTGLKYDMGLECFNACRS